MTGAQLTTSSEVPSPHPPWGADVVTLSHWLCSIASPIGEEQALCDLLLARAAAWGGTTTRVLNSFVVQLRTTRAGDSGFPKGKKRPKIALVGHLDTVRTEHEGPARIEGDRLYGAGAADMKSGLSFLIALAENPALQQFADFTLVFYSREEGPFAENELGPLLASMPELAEQDLAICLEPSNNKLQLGCMGSIHAKLTVRGRTSHSARPWQGENAIHKAWPLLQDLFEREPETREIDGLTYRGVMSATLASGGRGRNVIPDLMELNLNYRFLPGVGIEQAQEHVRTFVQDRAEVVFTDLSPSALPYRSHPLVDVLVAAGVTTVEPKQAWTDVARFSALGVAAVNWGPGDQAQAHQKNEFTSIATLLQGWEMFCRFALLLGQ